MDVYVDSIVVTLTNKNGQNLMIYLVENSNIGCISGDHFEFSPDESEEIVRWIRMIANLKM
jgi:hypothetical protein